MTSDRSSYCVYDAVLASGCVLNNETTTKSSKLKLTLLTFSSMTAPKQNSSLLKGCLNFGIPNALTFIWERFILNVSESMMSTSEPTLFEQIGGQPVIDSFIDDFYGRVLADTELAPFFIGVPMDKLRTMQKAFFGAALGGPTEYTSSDLVASHQRLKLTTRHLSLFTDHLLETLEARGMDPAHANAIVARIATYSRQILGESNVDG